MSDRGKDGNKAKGEVLAGILKMIQDKRLLGALFTRMTEGVIIIAPDGAIVEANPAAERILGLARDTIKGRNFIAPEWELIDEEGSPLLPQQTAGPIAMRERRPVQDNVMGICRPDDTVRWINVGATPLLERDGSVGVVVGIFTDVTSRIEAEHALRESEEKFKAQFKGTPVPVYVWSRDGDDMVLTAYNDAAVQITQGGVEKTLGIKASVLYEDEPEIRDEIWRCVTGHQTIRRQMHYKMRFSGETKLLDVTYTFVPPDMVLVHTEDISERDQAESALRESEARFKALFLGMPIPSFIWRRVGDDLVLNAYNNAANEFAGGRAREFVGLSSSVLLKDDPKIHDALKRCFADGTTVEEVFDNYSMKTTGERTCLSIKYVLVAPDTVLAHTEDVTERTRAERALKESEEGIRSILASMEDLVFVLDTRGAFQSFHQPERADKLFAAPEHFVGKTLEEVLPPHVARLSRKAFLDVLATGQAQQFDYPLEIRGKQRWFTAKLSVRRNADGDYSGVTVVVRDITARKRAQLEVEHAQQTLEQRVEERTRELVELRDEAEQVAAMRERERLARDLHDAVTQTLFSVSLIADALPAVWERNPDEGRQRLQELRGMTRSALAEMRGLLLELRSTAMSESRLEDLLHQLAETFGGPAAPDVRVTSRGGDGDPGQGEDGLLPDRPGGPEQRLQACRRQRRRVEALLPTGSRRTGGHR